MTVKGEVKEAVKILRWYPAIASEAEDLSKRAKKYQTLAAKNPDLGFTPLADLYVRKAQKAKRQLSCIDEVLDQLDPEERELIEDMYFKRYGRDKGDVLSSKYFYSHTSILRKAQAIVGRFASEFVKEYKNI